MKTADTLHKLQSEQYDLETLKNSCLNYGKLPTDQDALETISNKFIWI